MQDGGGIEAVFQVLLYQDNDQDGLWRASSAAPYLDPGDYGYHSWTEVVDAVLNDIKKEAAKLIDSGIQIRVNFIPARVGEDHKVIRSGYQPVIFDRSSAR